MTRRLALHAVIGFTAGAAAVATLGLGLVIADWQTSVRRTLTPRRITK